MESPWKGAADWLRNHYQDYPNVASLCEAMKAAAQSPSQGEMDAGTEASADKLALTDEQIQAIAEIYFYRADNIETMDMRCRCFARAIIATLKGQQK